MDCYHQRKVSFDTKEELGDKIDKLAAHDRQVSNKRQWKQTGNLNHKSIRVEVEVRTANTMKETTRIGTDKITGQISRNRGQYKTRQK